MKAFEIARNLTAAVIAVVLALVIVLCVAIARAVVLYKILFAATLTILGLVVFQQNGARHKAS